MRAKNTGLIRLLAALSALLTLQGPVCAQQKSGRPARGVVGRIDPTAFFTRFELRNEYRSLQSGTAVNLLKPRLDYAFSKSLMARLEVPLVCTDPAVSGSEREAGLGDIMIRGAVRAAKGKGWAVIAGTELFFDTAGDDLLGLGKHRCGPLVFASIEVPALRSRFFPFYQHIFSFGGDDGRPDIHYASIRPSGVLTRWPNRWYTFLDPNLIIDFEEETGYGMNLELEVGRGLGRNVSAWVRPGVGLFGDMRLIYDWNLEVGLRWFFR